jgi:hypothetical protein
MLKDWRTLKVGDKVSYHAEDFDGVTNISGMTISDVDSERAIASYDGMSFWIDDDTSYQFQMA